MELGYRYIPYTYISEDSHGFDTYSFRELSKNGILRYQEASYYDEDKGLQEAYHYGEDKCPQGLQGLQGPEGYYTHAPNWHCNQVPQIAYKSLRHPSTDRCQGAIGSQGDPGHCPDRHYPEYLPTPKKLRRNRKKSRIVSKGPRH